MMVPDYLRVTLNELLDNLHQYHELAKASGKPVIATTPEASYVFAVAEEASGTFAPGTLKWDPVLDDTGWMLNFLREENGLAYVYVDQVLLFTARVQVRWTLPEFMENPPEFATAVHQSGAPGVVITPNNAEYAFTPESDDLREWLAGEGVPVADPVPWKAFLQRPDYFLGHIITEEGVAYVVEVL
jgi:hypothetical protein